MTNFQDVSELPLDSSTAEQLDMLSTRYSLAHRYASDRDVLEVACGPGFGFGLLTTTARSVQAFDIDPAMIARVRSTYGGKVAVRIGAADATGLPPESFDLVIIFEALYFMPDIGSVLTEVWRILRPGGDLLVCFANPERPDFVPSPKSVAYPSLATLRQMSVEVGFTGWQGWVAYPLGEDSTLHRLIRRTAIQFGAIPGSMRMKSLIKRLIFRRVQPLPKTLTELRDLSHLEPSDGIEPIPTHKVIYAKARK